MSTPWRKHEGKWHFVRLKPTMTPIPARLKYIDGYAHFWLMDRTVRFQEIHSWAGPIEFNTAEDLSEDYHHALKSQNDK